ncbi:MAG: RNA methyltransferase [Gammaproteobacteria bacterium]|nr:RNA methyltransferase [Gammaproteobacteria bacterium]
MKTSNVSIGLINPKSPDNVGSVMRAAGNFQVDSVFYTGKRYPRALMRNPAITDMRRKVGQNIPLTEVTSLIEEVPENMSIVCVEFAENAIPLPEYEHPENAFYIFGPEDGTLSQSIIDQADAVVYVPTIGCMNLAATVNVLLYDRLTKSSLGYEGYEGYEDYESNELIRLNRDINNRLKVREALINSTVRGEPVEP